MQIPHTSSPNKSIPIENIPMISPSLHVANRPMINRNKLLIQHSLLLFFSSEKPPIHNQIDFFFVFKSYTLKGFSRRQGKMAISLRTHNRPENVYLWHCWVAKIRESGSLFYGFCFRTHTSDGPRDRDQDLRECCLTRKNRDRCNNGGSLIRFSWQFAYSFQIIPISLWGSIQPSFEDWAGVVFILIMSLLSSVIANIFSIAQYNCKSAH